MTQNGSLVSKLAKDYGYLPYMIERYIKFLGIEGTQDLLEANEKSLKKTIRVNTLKTEVDTLSSRLEKKGIKLEKINHIPYGFKILKSKFNLGSTHEFLQGYYYLQNEASMLPVLVLSPKPSDVIIDMCAAPGSKATQLAQEMNNKGTLILIERNAKRLPKLEYNLRRMGIRNSLVINLDAINLKKLNVEADGILLDAPCTGEGLIRKDPRRKNNRNLSDLEKMARIQKNLLKTGLECLKPGAKLVYSTCSIAPEENEIVIHDVLSSKDDYSILKINLNYGTSGYNDVFGKRLRNDLENAKRLYPHNDDTIGFFMCLIQRNS